MKLEDSDVDKNPAYPAVLGTFSLTGYYNLRTSYVNTLHYIVCVSHCWNISKQCAYVYFSGPNTVALQSEV
jgi:hypothetical protein